MTASSTESVAQRATAKWEQEAKESIRAAIRHFARPLQELIARDANEGDTRLIVTDFLCEGLGYDKFEDLTTEFAVRGEWADYGVRIDKQLVAFIEVKRAAQKLNVRHLRQVETYAVKEGLEWLLLTNGQNWQVYHVFAKTGQQVETTLVIDVDLLGDDTPAHKVDRLFYMHRAALKRSLIDELWRREAATSATALTQVLVSQSVLEAMRREIRKSSGYNPQTTDIARTLRGHVIRPELLA